MRNLKNMDSGGELRKTAESAILTDLYNIRKGAQTPS